MKMDESSGKISGVSMEPLDLKITVIEVAEGGNPNINMTQIIHLKVTTWDSIQHPGFFPDHVVVNIGSSFSLVSSIMKIYCPSFFFNYVIFN